MAEQRRRRGRRPAIVRAGALVVAPLVLALAGLPGPLTTPSPAAAAPRIVEAEWDEAGTDAGRALAGHVRVLGSGVLQVQLSGAVFVTVPDTCRRSSVNRRRSWLSSDATLLRCLVQPSRGTVTVPIVARATDAAPTTVSAVASSGGETAAFPSRRLLFGEPPARFLRLLSSPDFLNGDVGDLRRGPGFWTPRRSENSINRSYTTALARILDEWADREPQGVLVAGDLVNARWGKDAQSTGNFGPVRTRTEQVAAVRRAARTYYPQWRERFQRRGLKVFPAPGDHEYGDNPWPRHRLALVPTFRQEFVRQFMLRPDGSPRYADRPRGSGPATAYAWRPHPLVQVVSLDVFDAGRQRMRIRLDPRQRRWLVEVLKTAQRDAVPYVIVQAHTPILGPVSSIGSSRLRYEGGARSDLWRIMKRYGVDAYLCGEVHDTTATTRDGILQLAHGGIFQFGLTTFAQLDFDSERLRISLLDFDVRTRDVADGTRLWETASSGMPKILRVRPEPTVIGTIALDGQGNVTERSGNLNPLEGGATRRSVGAVTGVPASP